MREVNCMIDFDNKKILITGAAGFIGFHLAHRILKETKNTIIIGIDNLNDYYDTNLKDERLNILRQFKNFMFIKGDIADKDFVNSIFEKNEISIVVNLAAQAGVRYSITNPDAYIFSNIIGFYNLIEECRHHPFLQHFVYASSSSVYGTNKKVPYSTDDKVDNPVSLYAATKKSDELIAHAYSKLYDIPCTGLRFFTVYGPFGRPDMAYFKFTDKMVKGEPIQIYNNGDMYRDFTYIDDIVTAVIDVMKKIPDFNEDGVRYKIYNIGNNHPESLMTFISTLEECLIDEGIISNHAKKEFLPMQPGDVYQTYADVDDLMKDFNFKPSTSLRDGLSKFANWYRNYYFENSEELK